MYWIRMTLQMSQTSNGNLTFEIFTIFLWLIQLVLQCGTIWVQTTVFILIVVHLRIIPHASMFKT